MKTLITSLALGLMTYYSQAQSPFEKKEKLNLTFYSDAQATDKIEKLEVGQFVFYALVELNKKDFKKPFGRLFGYTDVKILETYIEARDVSDGINKKDINVYQKMEELTTTLVKISDTDGKIIVKVDLAEDVGFNYAVEKISGYGKGVYPVHVRVGFSSTPIALGVIQWDLTDGGATYASAALASRADYTFPFSDAIDDPSFKQEVISDVESKIKIKIYQTAHGERVPYMRDLRHYRRNSISATFKDLEDGKCYTGSISAFEDGTTTAGPPYRYDRDARMNYGDEIPCSRVDK